MPSSEDHTTNSSFLSYDGHCHHEHGSPALCFPLICQGQFFRRQCPLSQKDVQQVTPGPQGSTGSSKAGQRDRQLGEARTETTEEQEQKRVRRKNGREAYRARRRRGDRSKKRGKTYRKETVCREEFYAKEESGPGAHTGKSGQLCAMSCLLSP